MKTPRPYRSHKFPACRKCQQRRSRCIVDVAGEPCHFCRNHGLACSSAAVNKRSSVTSADGKTRHEDSNSQIVGPVMARDAQALDIFLQEAGSSGNRDAAYLDNLSQIQERAVYQTRIPPRRPSPTRCACSRSPSQDLISTIEPLLEPLLANYFDNVHPAYPLLSEEFVLKRVKDHNPVPRSFFTNLTTLALFYHHFSIDLTNSILPNQEYACQAATAAMSRDIQTGGMFAITTTAINLVGRPSVSVVLNTISAAKMVALSNSIELNQDCRSWKLTEWEKNLRWKLWWAVLVQERWFHFAAGTPPSINESQYDVPPPTLDLLCADKQYTTSQLRASECYIELCRLTEILGIILPCIHGLRVDSVNSVEEQLLRAQKQLDRWPVEIPAWLDLHMFERGPLFTPVPGVHNLKLSYLAIRMLLGRMLWHETSKRQADPHNPWLSACHGAANDIGEFVVSLSRAALKEFWLPYNAHHFASAVMLSLRCALQADSATTRLESMENARRIVDCLRIYKSEYMWDMAEPALSQSEAVLRRIEQALPKLNLTIHHETVVETAQTTDPQEIGDHFWENPALQSEGFGFGCGDNSLEALFPELFSGVAEASLFESQFLDEV